MRPPPILLIALLGVGCADFGKLAQLKPRKVTMRVNDILTQPNGTKTTIPLPKAGLKPCLAWVDVALNDGWRKIEGEWVADGECVLHNVPPGELLVNFGQGETNAWLTMTVDDFDLGEDLVGRPYEVAPANTSVTLDLTGAAPLADIAFVSLYLPDFRTGLLSNLVGINPSVGVPMGMVGATSFPVTFAWKGLPLVTGMEDIDVYQGVEQTPNSLIFTLAKHGTARLVPVAGKAIRAPLAMSNMPTRAPGFPAISFTPKAYYDALKADQLNAELTGTLLFQAAVLDGAFFGINVQSVFQVDEKADLKAPATAVDPFPGRAWTQRVEVNVTTASELQRNNGRIGRLLLGNDIQGPAGDLTWLTSAVMSPVRDIVAVRRDGVVMDTSGDLDSAAPTLRWTLPAQGIPNSFIVGAYEVTEDPKDDKKLEFTRFPAYFVTDRPEVHIPPGLLKSGTFYVFTVLAQNCTAPEPGRPNRKNLQQTCGFAENRSTQFKTGN